MNEFNSTNIKKAFDLFYRIQKKGYFNRIDDPEDFRSIKEENIFEIVEFFCEEANLLLITKTENIYLIPLAGNDTLSYTNEELRNIMSLKNNTELYMVYIIIMAVIIKFYNGEEYNIKCRDVLNIVELETYITQKIKSLKDISEEETLGINFQDTGDLWLSMEAYDEKIKNYLISNSTRIAFILRTLNFLKKEGYVGINDDKEFFTTSKFDDIILSYYPDKDRKKAILDIIKGGDNA